MGDRIDDGVLFGTRSWSVDLILKIKHPYYSFIYKREKFGDVKKTTSLCIHYVGGGG